MKRIAKKLFTAFYRARGSYPATIAGQAYECDPQHATFFRGAALGRWEPQTFKIISEYLKPGGVYADIGAWIGPTVMHAARRARLVYAFEPDLIAYEHLLANIRLNKLRNVVPFNMALGVETGLRRIASFGEFGDSMTSLLTPTDGVDSLPAACLAWETFLSLFKPEKIDFMKIDVEGGEFTLLPAMKSYLEEHRPALYLSTHAPNLGEANAAAGMQTLLDSLSFYPRLLSESLDPIPKESLLARENVEGYKTFLFLP